MPSPTGTRLGGRAALDAVASPARLELIAALGRGPATTKTLAARLGRSRQSLYYHLAVMVRAGLVVAEAAAGDTHEQRFRLRAGRLTVGVRSESRQERAAAAGAARAILRVSGREVASAFADPATRLDGAHRQVVALRGKARLTRAELRRAHALIGELERVFRATDTRSGPTMYSLIIVLTPAREAGGVEDDG